MKSRQRGPRRAAPRAPEVEAEHVDLGAVRRGIDAIDSRIVGLLNERAKLAERAGAAKLRDGRPTYAPDREREVLDRLARINEGPLPDESLRVIYHEILSASRALESPLIVAYLGPEATFTHEAAKRHFGLSAHLAARRTIAEVFADVERGRAAYGVVPIENSQEGVVNHTLDLFVNSDLSIGAEILLGVHQHLLSRTGDLSAVTRVYSHAHAIAQCRQWLENNLAGVPLIDVDSTARAAELAAEDPSAAAIASEMAATLYRLQPAARRIEDMRGNATRFLVIGHDEPKPTGADRTSLVFALHDTPGILHRALAVFAKDRVNLTRIESRPSRRRAWDYIFFVDLEGHQKDPEVARVITALRKSCAFLKVLGSYPRGRAGQKRQRKVARRA